jgi:hypothetical protein
LAVHRKSVHVAALSSEHHEVRPAVVGIGREADQSDRGELVHHALDGLTGKAHVARDMRHWQPISGDSTEHLPAGTGQPDVADEPIARRQQPTVEPEDLEHEFGECFRSRDGNRRGRAFHPTIY